MFSPDVFQKKLDHLNENKKGNSTYIEFKKSGKMRILTINIPIFFVEILDVLKGKEFNDITLVVSRSEFIRRAITEELKKTFKFLNDYYYLKEKIQGEVEK